MKKTFSAFICALLVCTLLFTGVFCIGEVQAAFKPSVPQVIINLLGNAYDVPSSTETVTDPFTGKDYTITHPGYRVADWSFEVTVKNQPFTRYTDADGKEHSLRYVVEYKNHNEGEQGWKLFTNLPQYETQYTTSSIEVSCKYYSLEHINSLPDGSKLDFRVKAEVVYSKAVYVPERVGLPPFTEYVPVASSGWSDVQTITLYDTIIPCDETVSSSSPSQIETVPPVNSEGNSQPQSPDNSDALSSEQIQVGGFSLLEFSLVIILCTTLPVLVIALIYTRKTVRHKQDAQTQT
ncbi:MAG: hypothetical protein LBH79_00370 [Nitrososphaerota archaeon]|jgi:hypothetical protein|nr:hypothetical protein [Nitrososphaerota archaeon]